MRGSIVLTAAICRIMDWLLVQMTESYSETHNFTLRSARDDSSSSHIMVLLAQNLVNTHSLRGCAYPSLFWIRKKNFFKGLLAFIFHIRDFGQLEIFLEEAPWLKKFKNLSRIVKLLRNEYFLKKTKKCKCCGLTCI